MDRINGAGHIGHMFVAEDAGIGRPPTEITEEWLNGVQEEIVGVILGSGQVPNNADLGQLLKAIRSIAAPPGKIDLFAMNTAPSGWLKANGAAISRTAYANLFAVVGTTWGVGDGETTFQLPDFRGEFLRGFDDGRGVDVGRVFGAWQDGTWLRTVAQEWTGSDIEGSGPYSFGNAFAQADGELATVGVGQSVPTGAKAPSGSGYNNATTDNTAVAAAAIDPVSAVNHWIRFRSRNCAPLICIKY